MAAFILTFELLEQTSEMFGSLAAATTEYKSTNNVTLIILFWPHLFYLDLHGNARFKSNK